MYPSKRICDIVDTIAFDTLAEAGTDHCYIPIFAVKNGKVKKALAMDIGQGPLDAARQNVADHGLLSQIELRLGDGLAPMNATDDNYSTLVIAGMGGMNIIHILQNSRGLLGNFSQIILQPQSHIEEVRKFAHSVPLKIFHEKIISDGGKFYNILDCRPGHDLPYSKWDYKLGKILVDKKSPVFINYIMERLSKTEKILANMAPDTMRAAELSELYKKYKEVLYGNNCK